MKPAAVAVVVIVVVLAGLVGLGWARGAAFDEALGAESHTFAELPGDARDALKAQYRSEAGFFGAGGPELEDAVRVASDWAGSTDDFVGATEGLTGRLEGGDLEVPELERTWRILRGAQDGGIGGFDNGTVRGSVGADDDVFVVRGPRLEVNQDGKHYSFDMKDLRLDGPIRMEPMVDFDITYEQELEDPAFTYLFGDEFTWLSVKGNGVVEVDEYDRLHFAVEGKLVLLDRPRIHGMVQWIPGQELYAELQDLQFGIMPAVTGAGLDLAHLRWDVPGQRVVVGGQWTRDPSQEGTGKWHLLLGDTVMENIVAAVLFSWMRLALGLPETFRICSASVLAWNGDEPAVRRLMQLRPLTPDGDPVPRATLLDLSFHGKGLRLDAPRKIHYEDQTDGSLSFRFTKDWALATDKVPADWVPEGYSCFDDQPRGLL